MTAKFLHHRPGRLSDDRFDLVASGDRDTVDDFHSLLRKKSGNVLAIAYSWIERVEFNPSDGITLQVHGDVIHIKGRSLNAEVRPEVRLFQGIARYRVAWVQEGDRPNSLKTNEKTAIIEEIVW